MRKKRVNKKYKDRLFRLIFQDKEDLLELYNAVNGSHYDNPNELQITTLDDAIYMGYKNDISFLIDDILNLYEHQSTYNPNMTVRGFLYLADVYRKIIDSNGLDLYSSRLIRLPYPKYIVFYNGLKEMPDRFELRLSDSFCNRPDEEPYLEFITIMININAEKNKELMEHCRKLKEYSLFIAEVRHRIGTGEVLKRAVDMAIDYCISNNILADILSAHRAEVRDMFLYDYNHEKHLEIVHKNGHEEGHKEGREEGLKILVAFCHSLGHTYDDTLEAVSKQYGLTAKEAEKAMDQYWLS